MKKIEKKHLIIISIIVLISVLGISYAFFNYYQLTDNKQLITGDIYLTLNDDSDSISLPNIFPESTENARKRTDNVLTFSVSGVNTTTDQDIYYEILLNEGNDIEGKTRFNPKDLRIDLTEIIDGTRNLVVDAMSFSDFNERRIWVNTISKNTDSEINITYELRMWLSDDVLISDTDPKADYDTDTFKNSYANVKVSVYGDFAEKNIPLFVEADKTMVENNQAYFIATVTNNTPTTTYSLSNNEINDVMNLKITGTNSDIVFSYKDSLGNVVTDPTETLDLTYNFNKKTSVEVQVFVIPKNDANASTDVKLELTQNGEEIQNFIQRMDVYGNNFCLNNGFNKLYDCILASDSLAPNVSTAISNIEAKGEPNLNQTAPTYTYVEQITEDVTNPYSVTGYKFYFADSYELNPDTGNFTLINTDGSSRITDSLSDTYTGYYTCGGTNVGHPCSTIYKVKATSVSGTTYTITKGDKITYKIASSIRSEVGLYKTEDDYGDSYFFRGDVTNNNVLLGGYYWKIVRTNGDNSIRLIYNGTTSDATGNATAVNSTTYTYSAKYPLDSSPIGARYADPTYVGYMYGKNFERQTSAETTYSNIVALTQYYFGDSYEFDATTETFKLTTTELEPIAKTFSEMNETDTETGKKFYELYPYTCKSTSSTASCDVMIQVNSVTNETTAKVQYHSYSSVDKDSTRTNEMSSNAKTQLENWYSKNIVGKQDDNGNLITDYIVDGTFCNDRGTTHSTYNSGYLLNQTTYYAPYTRLTASSVSTSLKCSDDIRDKFSTTSSKGNALLTYPVALITADEVALAGGKSGAKNENFYLRTNDYYWTMSPSNFYSSLAGAGVWLVNPAGSLNQWVNVTYSFGVRAVINLRSDVLISKGDGSVENPFRLKLA